MSDLLSLDKRVIDAITDRIGLSDLTRNEIRNLLYGGRVSTVTNQEEFTQGIKQVSSEIVEAYGDTSIVAGIVGALEGGAVVGLGAGGLIFGKGVEIANELSKLLKGGKDENAIRNASRDNMSQIARQGVYHPPVGPPTRDPSVLIDVINRFQRSQAKQGIVPTARTFRGGDPEGGFRQRRPPIDDGSGDVGPGDGGPGDGGPKPVPYSPKVYPRSHPTRKRAQYREPLEDIELGNPVADDEGDDAPPRQNNPSEKFPPLPPFINLEPAGKGKEIPKAPPERTNPGDNTGEDYAILSHGWLRPEFKMIGTDFFDKQFSRKSMIIQNEEWAEFNFVGEIDQKNAIEIDNYYNDMIRYREPLFYPKYQEKLRPPTKETLRATKTPMTPSIQLFQEFKNKFDDADMGKPMSFTATYNRTPFDSNFRKLKIYNP